MSRTTTAPYRSPPPHDFPPAGDCTREQLLEIVAATIAGCHKLWAAPQEYIRAVCQLVEDLHLELETAAAQLAVVQGVGAKSFSDLLAERDQHQATMLELEASQAEEGRLRSLLAMRDTELASSIQLGVRFQSTTFAITGRTMEELQHEWAIADAAERAALERKQIRADRASTVASRYRVPDKIVVDVLCLDEPAVARAVTPREVIPEMRDVVEGR